MCNNHIGDYDEDLTERLVDLFNFWVKMNNEIAGEDFMDIDDNNIDMFAEIVRDTLKNNKELLGKGVENDWKF